MSGSVEPGSVKAAVLPDAGQFVDPYDYYTAMKDGSRAERLFHAARLELVRGMTPLQGSRVLDVGGGSGCLALPLAQSGCDVTVAEPGAQLLDTLQQHAERLGVQVTGVHADGRQLPFDDESFDVVVVASVVHLVPFAGELLAEAERVCRAAGHLVVAGPWQRHPKSMTRVKSVLRDGPLSALRGRSSRNSKDTFPFNERVLKQLLQQSSYQGAHYNYVMGYFATLWSPDRKA